MWSLAPQADLTLCNGDEPQTLDPALATGQLDAPASARMVRPYSWLLDRTGTGGIRLTDAGRLLADRAAEVLGRLDAAENELAAHAGLSAGRVRLAAFPSALGTIVPAVEVPSPQLKTVRSPFNLPLSLSMGAAEWSLLWYRRRTRRLLGTMSGLGGFRLRSRLCLFVALLQYVCGTAALMAAGAAIAGAIGFAHPGWADLPEMAAYLMLGAAMFLALLMQTMQIRAIPLLVASAALASLAMTATRTSRPVPDGRETTPRTC